VAVKGLRRREYDERERCTMLLSLELRARSAARQPPSEASRRWKASHAPAIISRCTGNPFAPQIITMSEKYWARQILKYLNAGSVLNPSEPIKIWVL
jgi:hypothetical protein